MVVSVYIKIESIGKSIGAGLSCNGLGGTATGAGIMFSGLIYSVSRNRSYYDKLFTLNMICFALLESFALFSLLIGFILMFS